MVVGGGVVEMDNNINVALANSSSNRKRRKRGETVKHRMLWHDVAKACARKILNKPSSSAT